MSQIKNLILDHPHYRHNPSTREAYRTALRVERKVRNWQRTKVLKDPRNRHDPVTREAYRVALRVERRVRRRRLVAVT